MAVLRGTTAYLGRMSEAELKNYWAYGQLPIGAKRVTQYNSQGSFSFAKPRANSPYKKVLNYMYVIRESSKLDILKNVFGLDVDKIRENQRATLQAYADKGYSRFTPDYIKSVTDNPLRGERSILFAALREAKLLDYSTKTKKWTITELGMWYVENKLGE